MPLYEYACRGCDDRFEVLQRMGAGAEGVSCPSCGGAELEREFSTFAAATASSDATPSACAAPGGCACAAGLPSCP